MVCCNFKPLFIASTNTVNCRSKSHLIQARNSEYKLSIPSNSWLHNLSCSTRISRPPPSFALLNFGISSLAQCFSPSVASDHHDPQIKHSKVGTHIYVYIYYVFGCGYLFCFPISLLNLLVIRHSQTKKK